MGRVYDAIDERLAAFMAEQPLFFVATAPLAPDGHVNVSPRGLDTFSVLGPHEVGWVDLTGSGIETIAHLRENERITVMFCSFAAKPKILRLYGRGRIALPGDAAYAEVADRHPSHPGARAVIRVAVSRVADSCGYAVPVMDLVGERDLLTRSAEKRGPEGLVAYRAAHDDSLDGLPGLRADDAVVGGR